MCLIAEVEPSVTRLVGGGRDLGRNTANRTEHASSRGDFEHTCITTPRVDPVAERELCRSAVKAGDLHVVCCRRNTLRKDVDLVAGREQAGSAAVMQDDPASA